MSANTSRALALSTPGSTFRLGGHGAAFAISAIGPTDIVIVDLDESGRKSVTNDAELEVLVLHEYGMLKSRTLYYRDTLGDIDEISHDGEGRFLGFKPGNGRIRPDQIRLPLALPDPTPFGIRAVEALGLPPGHYCTTWVGSVAGDRNVQTVQVKNTGLPEYPIVGYAVFNIANSSLLAAFTPRSAA